MEPSITLNLSEPKSIDSEKEADINKSFQIVPFTQFATTSSWLSSWNTSLAFRVQTRNPLGTRPIPIFNIWRPSFFGISLPRKGFPAANLSRHDLLVSKDKGDPNEVIHFNIEDVIGGIDIDQPPFYACKHCLRYRGGVYLADGTYLRFDDINEGELYQFPADPGVDVGSLRWKPDESSHLPSSGEGNTERIVCRTMADERKDDIGPVLAVLTREGIELLQDVINKEKAAGRRVAGDQILVTGIAIAFYCGWLA
ncbi:hypothetical protein N7476_000458 [Penicillium atrosanguineum]|uniref:Uncharacterized protein n=1 Tax=Penicillium atrosanguineum TaxID=1132637 RepID=A0A9W9QBQ2_9EURO|nr:hypothetical protein N7476_000458 [Penicillium atrosanguineum]